MRILISLDPEGAPGFPRAPKPVLGGARNGHPRLLDLLRPHRTWYAAVHLGGPWMPPLAMGALAVMLIVCNLVLDRSWGSAGYAIYFAGLALLLARDWIFPAADIRVEPRRPQLAAPGGWRPERGADAPPAIQLVNDRG